MHTLRALRALSALALLCHCGSDPSTPPSGGEGGDGGEAGAASEAGTSSSAGQGAGGEDTGGTRATAGSAGKSSGGTGSSVGSGGDAGSEPTDGGAGGSGTAPSTFMLGADISSLPESVDAGTTFVDTDGETKDLPSLLRAHGFNYVRLRAFVDPSALYGYANPNGDPQYVKDESYCDTEHTLELALQAKEAGMGFLLDLHYSDNWADPGKQVIPAAWRDATSIADLAARVQSYTASVVSTLVAGGARPDMVQLGNEITPGLLIHVPAAVPNADQWGNMNKLTNAVNGSTASFDNVATLLKAGAQGVKSIDSSIKLMLHVENTKSFPAVRDYVNAVRARGVPLDVLGLSCYPQFQGTPAIWQDTFEQLSNSLSDISFVIAEYNPEATRAAQIMTGLPNGRGLGTFFWEPTQSGVWGESLFDASDGVQYANAERFAEFDALKSSMGL